MFRLLNKSAIWHLCQCINNWLSGRPSRAGTTPGSDGRPEVHGRLVGQSVGGIKFLTLFRCAGSFTWATRIPSSGQR